MSLAVVYSRAQDGLEAPAVSVEVHLSNGLPSLSIVGLPETAVKESKDRVRAALLNSQFEFPARRITVNLAPADLPKEGGRFDLPIALGILAASGQVPATRFEDHEFVGELALSGELRPIRGVLPVTLAVRDAGRALVVPNANGAEAAMVGEANVVQSDHLLQVCAYLAGQEQLLSPVADTSLDNVDSGPDLADVRGQHRAKRALEICAAGGHSLLMLGPPGTGKTMLASRLAGLLPPMTEAEALESAIITSVSGREISSGNWRRRPFRAPHHTASGVALVGGGSNPRPGEISLAHHGVMFLDELPEFDRRVLEVLREPLESGSITISRAARQAEYPARFQLIAAMNPCPCGYYGDESGRCRCTSEAILRYRGKVSGPLLDRIDVQVEVPRQSVSLLRQPLDKSSETSAQVQRRVNAVREVQLQRAGKPNQALEGKDLNVHCVLSSADESFLEQAIERLSLSARAYHRILKVSRTIADLAGADCIESAHLAEAIGYRCLDRRVV